MDGATVAKLVTLLVLLAMFVGAVLITPRIWHTNDPEQQKKTSDAAATRKG